MSKRRAHALLFNVGTAFLFTLATCQAQNGAPQYAPPQSTPPQSQPVASQLGCPWLNAATAGGILGGAVTMTVTVSGSPEPRAANPPGPIYPSDGQRNDRTDMNCEFHRNVNSVDDTLKINVKTLADPSKDFEAYRAGCPSKVPLRGIGNEAYQCASPPGSKAATEVVVSLVRNRAFILTVEHAPESSASEKTDGLRLDTRNLAEEIAGSLF